MSTSSKSYRCRLCNCERLETFLTLDNAPADIAFMLKPEQFARDRSQNLPIFHCKQCGLVQIEPQFSVEEYYQDYLMTTSHSAQMQSYQREQSRDFVHRFDLVGKHILELGCGDGNYLEYLQAAGAHVVGVEPSARFRKIARERGYEVHSDYISHNTEIPGAPYDGFVTRQVLEHVPQINDFLSGIRRLLRPGAVGLIEVPSLEQAMKHARFYDFFADHVNYFSARTLRAAAGLNGFDTIDIVSGMNAEYNVALVRVAPEFDYDRFASRAELVLDDLRTFAKDCKKAGRTLAVWGAGGKGVASIAAARLENVLYVVDSDPFKQGLYTPTMHFPIMPPDHLKSFPVDALILTALAYKDEILREIRGPLGFRGKIAVLGERLEILSDES